MTVVNNPESSLVEIDLGDRARSSAQAILWIHSDIEISNGAEVVCTVRPREPFRPERLAVLAACAGAFDLVDLKVARCSIFTDGRSGDDVPAARYATAYELRPRTTAAAWAPGPHRAVVSAETRFGLSIISRTCPVGHDISVTARHRQDARSAALEVIILGTVLSEDEGYRTYLREQRALEQA